MILVSNGNMKVGNDTLIINVTSATDCPSRALGVCRVSEECYAMKAERMYKQVLPYRRRQAEVWETESAAEIARQITVKAARLKGRVKYLRISEAGDYRNQSDVDKAEEIARLLRPFGITTYSYTARSDLDFAGCDNLVVRGSGFATRYGETIVRPRGEIPSSGRWVEGGRTFIVCPGNCRNCRICKTRTPVNVVFPLH